MIHLLKTSLNNFWRSVMVKFLSTNRADWFHFFQMSVILSHRKTNSSTKYSLTSLLTTKIKERLSERAILAAKNKVKDDLKFVIQTGFNGTLRSFKSIDCVINENGATNYPIEFLNFLNVPDLQPDNLRLKVGSIVIMLRNPNLRKLYNGTESVWW